MQAPLRLIDQWTDHYDLLGTVPIDALHSTFGLIAIDRWVKRVLFDGVPSPIKDNVPGWSCIKILDTLPTKSTLVASAYLNPDSRCCGVAVFVFKCFFANLIQIRRDIF
jgi:hypothetical protein